MTTVEALRNLYVALGGEAAAVANLTTIPELVNALCDVAPSNSNEPEQGEPEGQ